MYFDAHLHLDDKEEVKKYISESVNAKVEKLFVNSTSLSSNTFTTKLAEKYDEVVPGFGLYPLEATKKDLKSLKSILENYKGKFFMGEIGLDFKFADEAQKKEQMEMFKEQLSLAKEYGVYVNVHSRYAQRQVIEVLEENKQEKVIMHWFTSSEKYVKRAVSNGYYINIGPTYLLGNDLYNIVKHIPFDKILFETDFPVEISGKKYYSKDIVNIAKKYCNDFGYNINDLEKQQDRNYKNLIG